MIRFRLTALLVLSVLLTTALRAHEVTYMGTVLAVEPTKVQVKTVDSTTKKEDTVWFLVDRNTKVKRGDTLVKFADAKIAKGERIAVTINHDAATKNLATEIRLAAASQ
jgi:hypothetical protein